MSILRARTACARFFCRCTFCVVMSLGVGHRSAGLPSWCLWLTLAFCASCTSPRHSSMAQLEPTLMSFIGHTSGGHLHAGARTALAHARKAPGLPRGGAATPSATTAEDVSMATSRARSQRSGCSRFPVQVATSGECLPSLHQFMAIRAVSPALAWVQNSRVRAFCARGTGLSARGPVRHEFLFSLLN